MNTTAWQARGFCWLISLATVLGCGEGSQPAVTASLPREASRSPEPAAVANSQPVAPDDISEAATESLILPDTTTAEPAESSMPAALSGESSIAFVADNRPQQPRAESSQGDAYQARPKVDPIAINGKYFEGWTKPKLAIVFSGRQDGYLEPCGCAGLDQQKGGMSRRHTFLRELEQRGWPVAALDVGGLVRRFGRQAELQFAIAAEGLKKMGYKAVGFGPHDLRLSAGEVVAAVAGASPEDTIFVSANVNLFDLTSKTRIIEAGGMKIGVTSVLGKTYQEQINNDEVVITPADEALAGVVGELAGCDVRVLLAHATEEETRELAAKFPQFELVVTADGRDIPPLEPETIEGGKTRLIEISPKSMYVIVAGFYDDSRQPIRFQRVALDSRYSDSQTMKDLMATYQDQLRQLGWRDLGIKAVSHPRSKDGDKLAGHFAGAESCKECHPTAYGIWSKSKHAEATETLAKLNPPRQFDAECVSCHATGWNPQEYYPFLTGFDGLDTTPHLSGNQCENCHGPGAAHVAAENSRNRTKRDEERLALKLTAGMALENVCIKCHDHDNSPEFNEQSFEAHYWPKVQHKGKK